MADPGQRPARPEDEGAGPAPGRRGHRDHRPRGPRSGRGRGPGGHGVPAVVNVAPVLDRSVSERRAAHPRAGGGPADRRARRRRCSRSFATATRSRSSAARFAATGRCWRRAASSSAAELAEQLRASAQRVDEALIDFAENTMTHLREEGELLAGGLELPRTRTRFRDRHVLIVVRGTTYRKDLRALRAYIRGRRPAAGRAWTAARTRSSRRAGSRTWCSATWTRRATTRFASGAELIVHAYPDGRAPGAGASRSSGSSTRSSASVGTSQDVAMLLAYEKGAGLIVSVGAHFNLVEFLERSRGGDVVDVPDPPAGGGAPGRRQGREPALQPRRHAAASWRCSWRRRWSCWRS